MLWYTAESVSRHSDSSSFDILLDPHAVSHSKSTALLDLQYIDSIDIVSIHIRACIFTSLPGFLWVSPCIARISRAACLRSGIHVTSHLDSLYILATRLSMLLYAIWESARGRCYCFETGYIHGMPVLRFNIGAIVDGVQLYTLLSTRHDDIAVVMICFRFEFEQSVRGPYIWRCYRRWIRRCRHPATLLTRPKQTTNDSTRPKDDSARPKERNKDNRNESCIQTRANNVK